MPVPTKKLGKTSRKTIKAKHAKNNNAFLPRFLRVESDDDMCVKERTKTPDAYHSLSKIVPIKI